MREKYFKFFVDKFKFSYYYLPNSKGAVVKDDGALAHV